MSEKLLILGETKPSVKIKKIRLNSTHVKVLILLFVSMVFISS